ncbi:MAG TPA: FkbM family methyltransferase [Polyangiaceae bacterium]
MGHELELEGLPLLRTVITQAAVSERDVIVSGVPAEWSSTAEAIRGAGGRVIGFHAVVGASAAEHDGLPVKDVAQCDGVDSPVVVFGGAPKKSWFTCAPPAPQSCFWTKPLNERLMRGRYSPKLLQQYASELGEVHGALADPLSQSTFRALVKGRVAGDSGYFHISPYAEYEHPIVSARPGNVVLDVGAYDGDTARRYSARVGPQGRVFALEPSHLNYLKLSANCASEGLDNVLPLCVGGAAAPGLMRFQEGNDASSALATEGNIQVPVTSLDRLVHLLNLPSVDVIKLDVEGAEERVLEGAWQSIQQFRPMLQVSIYHKAKDLFALPLLLMRRLEGYTYFMGHHSFYHVESDLYCCPNERLSPYDFKS